MKMFKLGDTVSVLDDTISGVIIKLSNTQATIRTLDDFEMEFPLSNLIIEASDLDQNVFSKTSFNSVIKEKEPVKKPRISAKKPKERFQPTMEVDLHVHQLTKSSKHLSKHDILNLQVDTAKHKLEFAMRKRIQKIVFIHGVGEGILKLELQYLFDRYANVKYYDANYQKYGVGATEVYIYQNINP